MRSSSSPARSAGSQNGAALRPKLGNHRERPQPRASRLPPSETVTVVVTGTTGTVGRALAEAFAERGCALVVLGHDPAKLAALRRALPASATGGEATIVVCDLAHADQVYVAATELAAWLTGDRVVLVNCAAEHGPLGPVWQASGRARQRVLGINLVAVVHLGAVLPGMVRRGWGRIINVSSSQGGLGQVGRLNAPYALSKHALNRYAAQLAVELAGSGVTAHAMHRARSPPRCGPTSQFRRPLAGWPSSPAGPNARNERQATRASFSSSNRWRSDAARVGDRAYRPSGRLDVPSCFKPWTGRGRDRWCRPALPNVAVAMAALIDTFFGTFRTDEG